MNWIKILIAGVLGGLVVMIYNLIAHGFILGATYTDHPAFRQDQANRLWFLLIAVAIGVAGALLFAKSPGAGAAST